MTASKSALDTKKSKKTLTGSELNSLIKKKQWHFYDQVCEFIKSSSARFLLQTIVRYADKKSSCWRSISTLASSMGVSEKTVKRSIKFLELLDIIKVDRIRTTKTKRHNIYYLNFDCKLLQEVELTTDLGICGSQDGDIVSPTKDSNSKSELGKDKLSVTKGSNCPVNGDTVTPKYILNKHLNKAAGADRLAVPSYDLERLGQIDPDLMNMWSNLKGFVKRAKKPALASLPSEEDVETMKWAIKHFSLDPKSQNDGLAICEFVINELGESETEQNPLARLKMAAEESPQGINHFLERFKECRKTDS